MTWLDLNADLGEGVGNDQAMLEIVSSANIACGGHAGDHVSMVVALRAAKANSVTVGAHPGFADPENFGRRRMVLPPQELDDMVRRQVRDLAELAVEEGVPLKYVKLHGALANMAAEEPAIAAVSFAACEGMVRGLGILAIDNSAQVEVAETMGFPVVREAYADRAYLANGLLMPRSEPGAVIHDPAYIADRAIRLAQTGEIVAADGTVLRTEAKSLCIHGDNPAAVEVARQVRSSLEAAGIAVRSAF